MEHRDPGDGARACVQKPQPTNAASKMREMIFPGEVTVRMPPGRRSSASLSRNTSRGTYLPPDPASVTKMRAAATFSLTESLARQRPGRRHDRQKQGSLATALCKRAPCAPAGPGLQAGNPPMSRDQCVIPICSTALRVAAVQAGHAAVHRRRRRRCCTGRTAAPLPENAGLGECIGLLGSLYELRLLLGDQFLRMFIELLLRCVDANAFWPHLLRSLTVTPHRIPVLRLVSSISSEETSAAHEPATLADTARGTSIRSSAMPLNPFRIAPVATLLLLTATGPAWLNHKSYRRKSSSLQLRIARPRPALMSA